jgi:hypothetical protein
MGSVVAYGHALAGWGVTFLGGEMNFQYIVGGLSIGTLSAILAIWLWKIWLRTEEADAERRESNSGENQ